MESSDPWGKSMINNITCWLDAIAKKYPDKIAYSDENCDISFSDIRNDSITLANKIISMVNSNKQPVMIYMDKSVDIIICFFAVAYSGDFYTPIDIKMPDQRAMAIMDTLNPSLVITKTAYCSKPVIKSANVPVIFLDELSFSLTDETAVLERQSHTIDTDLLYVLFTSGSTGVPKGVSVTHRAVMDYIECIEDVFGFGSDDSLGNQAPFYFDNSVLDIYVPLKTGSRTYIIPEALFLLPTKTKLLTYLKDKKINTIFWVPSALIAIVKTHALDGCDLDGILDIVLFAGEVMPNSCLNIWRKYLPNALYANLYGPTEIAVDCTYYIVDREFGDDDPLPIGKAFKNTDILVLNQDDNLVVDDEIGELCVRGTSLAMGYYNNPDKTQNAFVQNPLNTTYPELIYRTGDLVKYNEFGEIEYIGRKDNQIKYMGYRIELGEIESATMSMSTVTNCACLYDEARKQLVLFVEGSFETNMLKNHLKTRLPQYMLPKRLIALEELPLNMNGKINRIKLKEMIDMPRTDI